MTENVHTVTIRRFDLSDQVTHELSELRPLLYWYAARFLPWVDADDLVQEGLMFAWLAGQRFDPSHGVALRQWMALRAKGAMRDYARTLGRKTGREVLTDLHAGDVLPLPHTEDGFRLAELRVDMLRIARRLVPSHREYLGLVALGLNQDEVAQRRGRSAATSSQLAGKIQYKVQHHLRMPAYV